jgi:hypothetical protein
MMRVAKEISQNVDRAIAAALHRREEVVSGLSDE